MRPLASRPLGQAAASTQPEVGPRRCRRAIDPLRSSSSSFDTTTRFTDTRPESRRRLKAESELAPNDVDKISRRIHMELGPFQHACRHPGLEECARVADSNPRMRLVVGWPFAPRTYLRRLADAGGRACLFG